MKAFRGLLATLLFILAGLPLGLAGLSLLAVRPLISGPQLYSSILRDPRTASMVRFVENYQLPAETSGSERLNPAWLITLRDILPPALVIDSLDRNIQAFFDQARQPAAAGDSFRLDISQLRSHLQANSGNFWKLYAQLESVIPPEALTEIGAELGQNAAGNLDLTAVSAQLKTDPDLAAALGPQTDQFLAALPSHYELALPAGFSLVSLQQSYGRVSLLVGLSALMFMVAAAFIKESSWRKRAISLGGMLMVPGVMVLVLGVLPRLINPTAFLTRFSNLSGNVPELMLYFKFVSQTLLAGFLYSGLVCVVAASALLAVRFVPSAEDDSE
jgi:hypothetical protein